MKFFQTALSCLTLLILVPACTNDASEKDAFDSKLLIGKWELAEAFRNNKPTESLDNAFLEFKEDGTMKTNIFGTEEEGTYKLSEKKLTAKTTRTVDYSIEKLEPGILILNMTMAQYKFKLNMKRV